ncbi:O-antigen translocase [Namhaeicola litoreus]|uniref:O-antigen translocase n=1 Tax=Namhaeicola litoreus TaxID=1052145 RepID=A0ABW3Y4P3_9FLAO
MSNQKNSYNQILKATSIFGGVQIFNVLISIIKSKLIAVLVGPAGIGILGLFNTSLNLIGAATNFGLKQSAVRNVALAHESADKKKVSEIISIFRKIVWATGVFGSLTTIILSGYLSQFVFGNKDYQMAFIWLSISLLFNQLTAGQYVLLQGLRKLKLLAKANLIGAAISLIFTIPLYYYYRIDAIVPSIVISSIIIFLVAFFFGNSLKIEKVAVSRDQIVVEGKDMLQMGIALSFSGLVSIGNTFLIKAFINNQGGVSDVGLYTAGFAIITTYVGVIFTAMSTDYYPRLSGVSEDNKKSSLLINHQAEISLILLSPILVTFIVFIHYAIIVLYSSKFVEMDTMLEWAALGMYFKAASWCIAYILLAKGESKLFFINELIANIYGFCLNILGYHFYGLEGLGFGFFIGYIIYLFHMFILANRKYGFEYNSEFIKIFILQFIFGITCLITKKYFQLPYTYISGALIIFLSSWFSIYQLKNKVDFSSVFNQLFKKNNK